MRGKANQCEVSRVGHARHQHINVALGEDPLQAAEHGGLANGWDSMLKGVKAVRVSNTVDAGSIYDCLDKRTGKYTLTEKRADLETMADAQCIKEVGIETRWCHSEANLADSLTKTTAPGPMELYMKTHRWALVEDDEQLSAKKRRTRGLGRFDKNTLDADFLKSVEQVVRLPEVTGDDNAFQAMMDHVLEPMPP